MAAMATDGTAKTQPKDRTSPAEFSRQVRTEMRKVTWPTRKETMVTTAMVFLMSVVFAIFFLVVDQYFAGVTKALLDPRTWTLGEQLLAGSFALILAFVAWRMFTGPAK
jgi:preprotein translocase subunit SecE